MDSFLAALNSQRSLYSARQAAITTQLARVSNRISQYRVIAADQQSRYAIFGTTCLFSPAANMIEWGNNRGEDAMGLLMRWLDWLCEAYAAGVQDEARVNQLLLIVPRRNLEN